jgi:transposase
MQLHGQGVAAAEIAHRLEISRASVYRVIDDARAKAEGKNLKVAKTVCLGTSTVLKLKNWWRPERPHSELAMALEQSPPFFVCLAPRRAFDLHPTALLA